MSGQRPTGRCPLARSTAGLLLRGCIFAVIIASDSVATGPTPTDSILLGPPPGPRWASGPVSSDLYEPIHSSFHAVSYFCSLQYGL